VIDRTLERFVLAQMIASKIPGLSLVLLRDGAVAERHFGFRELRLRQPPTAATRYGIGSVTKVFTALAVMQLVDEGRVDLDAPLSGYLPVEAAVFGAATVRQVLAHASGLPALGWSETKMSPSWPMDGYPVGGYDDLGVLMDGFDGWRTADPGERWHYSNEGYILLGLLIERLDGRPFAAALQAPPPPAARDGAQHLRPRRGGGRRRARAAVPAGRRRPPAAGRQPPRRHARRRRPGEHRRRHDRASPGCCWRAGARPTGASSCAPIWSRRWRPPTSPSTRPRPSTPCPCGPTRRGSTAPGCSATWACSATTSGPTAAA
jgi:hypothetical protein